MNELIIETVVENDKVALTGLSHDEIGDEHIMTGIETPMVKDAFEKAGIEFLGSPQEGAGVRWKIKQ